MLYLKGLHHTTECSTYQARTVQYLLGKANTANRNMDC